MTQFETRYKKLNEEQRRAVDTIDGPLLVVAGPGTGKTELLSMRAARILQQTDTLPESILCLTFTDSGATAMRERLSQIIGADAYKVAIHTFHSFGTEVINHNNQYFYRGADFKPADELSSYEILTEIFDELDYSSPLASKNNGDYTHLSDTRSTISELKQAGLSSDELLAILNTNEVVLDTVERELSQIFASRVSTSMLSLLVPLAEKVASLPPAALPPGITPLGNTLALSMAHAFDEAVETNKTTPITAWRNRWLEKDDSGTYVFKDRKRHTKLRAVAHIYFTYLARMEQAGLYDYDDMILNVVHGMELHPDLKFNLQEKYQYIMVDEFQDTNLAQLRILFNLTDTTDSPNIMAVGDDDQAIYSFQGADVDNIHRFRDQYTEYESVVLRQNYRSGQQVLDRARSVVVQADGRLENSMEISKQLTAASDITATVNLVSLPTKQDERSWLAESISRDIEQGTKPESIAVLARRHSELTELMPYLHHAGISVNYERRDNVLELESIQTLELLSRVCVAIFRGEHEEADSLLPELLAHPMYEFEAEAIWRLSLASHRNHLSWLETMLVTTTFKPLAVWLIDRARAVPHETLEVFVDTLIGVPSAAGDEDNETFVSPYYAHYFGETILAETPDAYLTVLDALRTIRTKLREYHPNDTTRISDLLEFIHMHRQLGSGITSVRRSASHIDGAISVMTAHKSKGLEFDTVYIVGSVDNAWGERVRSRNRLIAYPDNLRIAPSTDSYDERVRLYYVAMTRAKRQLIMSYATHDDSDRDCLPASFLVGANLDASEVETTQDVAHLTAQAQLSWIDRLTDRPTDTMKQLLAPLLENYKLSSTHLNNFIDLSRGGPTTFLVNNLLRFPQAKSASASYGTAMHATLQRAHNHLTATGERRPIEDVLGDFIHELHGQHLDEADEKLFEKRGTDSLTRFLAERYQSFARTQKTELGFGGQHVQVGSARLTGSLDLVDIDDGHIVVTDYKTGKPSSDWKGSGDAEKIKLHKYKQQLMFYQLLCENSRDYSKYSFDRGVLQFVEPDRSGKIHALEESFSDEDLERFTRLIAAVWRCITTLELPDTTEFEPSYKGVLAFEAFLIDKYSK